MKERYESQVSKELDDYSKRKYEQSFIQLYHFVSIWTNQ